MTDQSENEATTELERAFRAMSASPGNDAARLAYYGVLADTALALHLEDEPEGEDLSPVVLELGGVSYVSVFDGEDKLADHAHGVAEFASLSGRGLSQMLRGQGVGMAVDRGTRYEMLLPPDAVDWLAGTLATGPTEGTARPVALRPPPVLPEGLESALQRKLTGAGALAETAWLAMADYDDGNEAALIVVVGARAGTEEGLAAAISEALTFSGLDNAHLDVAFADSDAPLTKRVARVGRELELSRPAPPEPPSPPGSDPGKPPRLR